MDELYVTGHFDFYFIDNLDEYRKPQNYRRFGRLDGLEWANIFYGVLKCPTFFEFDNAKTIEEQREKYIAGFLQAIADYPMLQRLDDIYRRRILFDSEQLKELHLEVIKVLAQAKDNHHADFGLRKLLKVCELALEIKKYLLLD